MTRYMLNTYIGKEYDAKFKEIKKILLEKEHPEARPHIRIGSSKIVGPVIKKEIDRVLDKLKSQSQESEVSELKVNYEISDDEIKEDQSPLFPPIPSSNVRFGQ